MQAGFRNRFAVVIMNSQMAIFTQCNTVGRIESKFGMVSPRLDVVSFQFAATLAATLAGVVARLQYKLMPSLVFISGRILSRLAISFVSWVILATLKMRCGFPFFGLRTALDSIHDALSFLWVRPSSFGADAVVLSLAKIGAFLRAIRLLIARRISELISAYRARSSDGRMLAFNRAVNVVSFLLSAWSRVNGFSASGTMNNDSALLGFRTQNVTAFFRASCLPTMLEPIRISVILISAYRASALDSRHLHSCFYCIG